MKKHVISSATLAQAGEKAAESLGAWINRQVSLNWIEPENLSLEQAGEMLGPADQIVPACVMEVHGPLKGRLVLVADSKTVASFVNAMLGESANPTKIQTELMETDPKAFWDELSQSAALETANIVACAYLNALATTLPENESGQLLPSPPQFVLDYAGSLGQFLLFDLAMDATGILVTQSQMLVDNQMSSNWRLVWIPTNPSQDSSDSRGQE